MSAALGPAARPAEQLVGMQLPSGWKVVSRVTKPAGHTGGNFCVSYVAEKDGKRAFLKAIDFVGALGEADPLAELQKLTARANFERDVLQHCSDANLSRIVRLLDAEYVSPPAFAADPMRRVFCLILEVGDGDIRKHANFTAGTSAAWKLAVLKDVSLGLQQLHRRDVAHLDVKPSNVLSFPKNGVKLGDLGRVVRKNVAGPFDQVPWPGDIHYSPPEVWYGYRASEWQDSRVSGDAYLLGNLFYYLFVGTSFSAALCLNTPEAYQPGKWAGPFRDALLVLRDVQVQVIRDALLPTLPGPGRLRDELHLIALQLTHPDPSERGDPRARRQHGRGVGVDRYVARFDRLAKQVEVMERLNR